MFLATAKALRKLLSEIPHCDEEYLGDHWATGRCPRCNAELRLGLRNPGLGGKTLEEHYYYAAIHDFPIKREPRDVT